MNAADLARAALGYARRGLRVHPCAPGKKVPLLEDWPNRATLDARTIENWWHKWTEANIGIATGREFRLLVIDVDPDAGGEATIDALERENGRLITVEVVTPRGGRHLYLTVPSGRPMPGNSAGKLGDGIDTRGQGGYVLGPPSVVNGRPYTWSVDSGDRFATAPDWVLERLGRSGNGNGTATPPEEWLELVTAGVDEGARNHTIARIAGMLLRRLPEPQLAAELVACFNQVKCRPPLEAAELKRTIDSIAAKEMRRRGLANEH